MSRRPARGYYRVQVHPGEEGSRFDVWRTDRHPKGVELLSRWFTLSAAGDVARIHLDYDRRSGVLP